MKKMFLLAAAFVAVAGLSSCKKDYTCECTYTVGSATTTDKTSIFDAKKKDAQDICDSKQNTFAIIYPNVSCSLN